MLAGSVAAVLANTTRATPFDTGGSILHLASGGKVGGSGHVAGYQFGINRIYPLTVTQPPVIASIERLWDSHGPNGNLVKWAQVETARGVYNWTVLDALVADIESRGADMIYTFGWVPSWANGGRTQDVPPTNFTDFYNFVTAVVRRYSGQIKYYEAWNEPDLGGTLQYWSGTVSQMVTLATRVYSIVHGNDPTALAVMPCISGGIGGAWTTGTTATGGGGVWFDQFLAAGGGAGADVVAIHMYGTHGYGAGQFPNTDPPEQCWWAVEWIKTELTAYGLKTMPLLITEGGWGENPTSTGHNFSDAELQAWGATWPAFMASAGADRMLWYASDSPNWGVLTSRGLLTPGGLAYTTACKWLDGAAFVSPIGRQRNGNAIANPNGTNTTGKLPTGWTINNPDVYGNYGMN